MPRGPSVLDGVVDEVGLAGLVEQLGGELGLAPQVAAEMDDVLQQVARVGAVEVAVPGGVANNLRQVFAGAPEFNTGDEYVFFLWTGKSGITQVIGLTQGLFAVSAGTASDPVATRVASRELMLEPGTARQVKDQTLVMKLSDLRAQIASTLGTTGQGVAK